MSIGDWAARTAARSRMANITSAVMLLITCLMNLNGCATSDEKSTVAANLASVNDAPNLPVTPLKLAQQLESPALKSDIRQALELQLEKSTFSSFGSIYRSRDYYPLWVTQPKNLQPLLAALGNAQEHGLNPAHYHWLYIKQRLVSNNPVELAELDLILSKAFIQYGEDLSNGRFDPRTLDQRWYNRKHQLSGTQSLASVATNDLSVESALKNFPPPYSGYQQLKRQVPRFLRLASEGGWPVLPLGDTLELGAESDEIGTLRQRLSYEMGLDREQFQAYETVEQTPAELSKNKANNQNDNPTLTATPAQPELRLKPLHYVLTPQLAETLRVIQKRYGLVPSGELDNKTRRALNVSPQARAQQVLVNMERYRWLPRQLGEHYLLVDVADFSMQVIKDGRRMFSSPIIVGRADRDTPSFSDELQYIEFHPQWNLPNTVIYEDVIPAMLKDPQYLSKKKIRLFSGWDSNAVEVNPADVDWRRYRNAPGQRLPYRLRQDAGKHNALGLVKFMFPNPFNVYLHDTPSKSLFNKSKRTFSSGCIRVRDVNGLTRYLFANAAPRAKHKVLDDGDVTALFRSGKNQRIQLSEPLPIHIIYFTNIVNAQGIIEFRDDFYNRDDALIRVFNQEAQQTHSPRHAALYR